MTEEKQVYKINRLRQEKRRTLPVFLFCQVAEKLECEVFISVIWQCPVLTVTIVLVRTEMLMLKDIVWPLFNPLNVWLPLPWHTVTSKQYAESWHVIEIIHKLLLDGAHRGWHIYPDLQLRDISVTVGIWGTICFSLFMPSPRTEKKNV